MESITSTLKSYFALFWSAGGRSKPVGSLRLPVERTFSGQGRFSPEEFVVGVGEFVKVFDATEAGGIRDFSAIVLQNLSGHGTLDIALVTDTVDGDGDFTGANVKTTAVLSSSCLLPLALDDNQPLTNPTAADITGYTAGEPTIYGDAGTVRGKIREVWVGVPGSASASVKVGRTVME